MSARDGELRPIETPDGWQLEVGDGVVTQLQIDYAFGFTIEMSIHVRIQTPFTFDDGKQSRQYDPNEWTTLGPLLELHQATVTSATAHKSGRLEIALAGGMRLTADPDPHYESFTISSADTHAEQRFLLVGLPGHGVASR
jgi:hypothetical protein